MSYTYTDYMQEWAKLFGYANKGDYPVHGNGTVTAVKVTQLNEIEFKIAMAQYGLIQTRINKSLGDKSIAPVKIEAMYNVLTDLEATLLL